MTGAALYTGEVYHARRKPLSHRFRYRVFSLLVDLDRTAELGRLKLFSVNRFNVYSFHDKDHGEGSGRPAADWARERLAEAGLADAGMQITLLCFPRLFGYVFNPLAIYYCYDAQGALKAVIHQVSNTFGERHSYVLPAAADETGLVRQSCAKRFYVSPFIAMDGGYRFRLRAPGDELAVAIRQDGPADAMLAVQTGWRAPLTDRLLAKRLVTHPLMTLKVIAGIHWEAVRLWRKGAPFHRRPKTVPDAKRPMGSVR